MDRTASDKGARLLYGEIRSAGAYVTNGGGHLMRVTPASFGADGTPVIDLVTSAPQFVTKIDDDPFVRLTAARILASDLDLPVNF